MLISELFDSDTVHDRKPTYMLHGSEGKHMHRK